MTDSVWVLSDDLGSEGLHTIGIFKTRRRMIKAIHEEFKDVNIIYSDDIPIWAQAYRNGHYYSLSMQRHKLDKVGKIL